MNLLHRSPNRNFAGPNRREVLRAGLKGFSSLSLAGLYNLRSQPVNADNASANHKKVDKPAVILVWLRGGASHLETFDTKPLAPSDYRGPYQTINTNVPGIDVCELLPRLSQCADKYAVLRSIKHTGGGHPAGSLQVLGGDTAPQDKPKPIFPDWMSVVNHLHQNPGQAIPNYVAINPVDRYDSFQIAGPAYLGPACEPFKVLGDPSRPDFQVPNIGMKDQKQQQQLMRRIDLKSNLDQIQRQVDQTGMMHALDNFENQALNLLTSKEARAAFDLSNEPKEVRQRYGQNAWGQQCLMARRLVEAGVEVVATEFDGPLCGRVQNWDDHAVNHHVFDALKFRLPTYDQAVSALIEDIYDRGLDKRVLVIVAGEFGRTPRISHVASSGGGVASGAKGTVQPGRDHWPRANSMIFAGGGIKTGQIIGATDPKGEDVIERPFSPGDFLATIYHHLGIDYANTALIDFSGRPNLILPEGHPIPELAATY